MWIKEKLIYAILASLSFIFIPIMVLCLISRPHFISTITQAVIDAREPNDLDSTNGRREYNWVQMDSLLSLKALGLLCMVENLHFENKKVGKMFNQPAKIISFD